jgi:quinol monooxygenase YgiN
MDNSNYKWVSEFRIQGKFLGFVSDRVGKLKYMRVVDKTSELHIKVAKESRAPMSKTAIRVVARVIALPDKVEEVKSILMGLIEPTRQEEGCIAYELLHNHQDPTDFTFVEEWESQALLNAHLASEHIAQASSQLSGLIASEPDIRVYHLLS